MYGAIMGACQVPGIEPIKFGFVNFLWVKYGVEAEKNKKNEVKSSYAGSGHHDRGNTPRRPRIMNAGINQARRVCQTRRARVRALSPHIYPGTPCSE